MMISCCLIGEDSLLIQCGNILLAQNCWIERVVSPIVSIQEWAEKNGIAWVSSLDELLASHFNKVDYLFSIVNSHILSSSILQLAQHGAINYHDSLLPQYAGLNATTWAIVNNEQEHGVTWHVVSDRIDEGDIVKQTKFSIYPEDTAFTLNLRCYEYAIQSFKDLISEIQSGSLTYTKQSLQNRSYFGIAAILPNFGFIDWDYFSAELIVQLCKATTLGHYNNNVGFLKIYLENDYIIVPHATISEMSEIKIAAGTIIAIDDDALFISTITNPIKIDHFISKAGARISMDTLINTYRIKVGLQLKNFHVNQDYFKNLYSHVAKNEKYWLKQLNDLTEHAMFLPACQKKETGGKLEKLHTKIQLTPLLSGQDKESKVSMVLAAICIYLYRLNDYEKTSVSLVFNNHQELVSPCGKLFASFLPLVLDWKADMILEEILINVIKLLEKHEKSHTFFTDLAARHPSLENKKIESGIVIDLRRCSTNISLPDETLLYFQYDSLQDEVLISHAIDENYHSGLLKETLHHLTEHLTTILDYLVTKPHVKVSEFCFVTQSERDKLLNKWGKGEYIPLPNQSLSALFEKQVSSQPSRPAVLIKHRIVTYSELGQMVDKVAFAIKELALPAQSLIGMYVHRSVEMLAILFGILKADCVYVPIDTKYPLIKIEMIANEAQLSHLITSEPLKDNLLSYLKNKQIINLLLIESILANVKINDLTKLDTNLASNPVLAYVMFTSGTTGTPKGVVVTQKNILNYCLWFTKTTNFTPYSIIDFSSSIAFDLSVPCTIAPLITGGCIAICEEEDKTNPERYLKHLQRHKVTHTELTPGYVEMLLHYPKAIKRLIYLKFLLLGADVVHTQEVMKWLKLCPEHQVVNEYGPTETTVSVTSYFVNNNRFLTEAAVPIGRPAFNSTAYLLDKHKNICPVGMKGELYIGGCQVTNGYFGKPELTQEKFIPLAVNYASEILYKTGDLAAWLPDGYLQFFGRNDFQVKIQGYRIELPAIESVLLKMPGIEQAVVVVCKGHFKEKYLKAYIVSANKELFLSEIKDFLSAYLPSYMIPKEFCLTSCVPLKENEKIDFIALEKQPFSLLTFDHDVNETLTPSEQTIMTIWQHAFNSTTINHHDDFFAMGGDSLLALQIIFELKLHYEIDIPLFFLFEYPTVSLLASKIDTLMTTYEATALPEAKKSSSTVIKLSEGNDSKPLFLVHPVGGSVFWYKQLATLLQGKYTVFGIQDASIDGYELQFNTLEDMASYYLKEIESVYTGEHYYLGGASFGATVAFEMAHQLMALNKEIGFLGLFDGWAKYPDEILKENTLHLLSQKETNEQILSKEKMNHLSMLEEYRKKLLMGYKLTVLHSDVILFKAMELWPLFSHMDDIYNGWHPFVGGKITTYKIPGNHETILFAPNVHIIGRYLTDLERT